MIKTNIEFVSKLKEIATKYKTLYVMGCFGAPLKEEYKERYCNNYDYNKQPGRTAMIKSASADTFGFDCVCLIKGVLWGWDGNKNAVYGGAKYESNGVPDIDCDVMIDKCSDISTDFSKIEVGEAVWLKGHIGVYIGDGLAIECTPSWENKVQITAVKNIGNKAGYNARQWTKHGKLPYFSYVTNAVDAGTTTAGSVGGKNGYHVGDIVQFNGNTHYASSTASTGSAAKSGTAKITAISTGAKHPYHIIHTDDNSNVYGWVNAADIGDTAKKKSYNIGDVVQFSGKTQYVSSTASAGLAAKPGAAKITAIAAGAKHPYHVVHTDGKSNVYGWVNAEDI